MGGISAEADEEVDIMNSYSYRAQNSEDAFFAYFLPKTRKDTTWSGPSVFLSVS